MKPLWMNWQRVPLVKPFPNAGLEPPPHTHTQNSRGMHPILHLWHAPHPTYVRALSRGRAARGAVKTSGWAMGFLPMTAHWNTAWLACSRGTVLQCQIEKKKTYKQKKWIKLAETENACQPLQFHLLKRDPTWIPFQRIVRNAASLKKT